MPSIAKFAGCKMLLRKGLALGAAVFVLLLCGCSTTYKAPGAAADFHAMGITPEEIELQTDVSIARRLERKPLAAFPTSLAVIRVQGQGYRSHTAHGYGRGNYSVVTARDVESEAAFRKLAAMPMIDRVHPINRLVLPSELRNEESLRQAAASLRSDMVLVYTFDTVFETDKHVQPLGVITLGLFPDRTARVTSTASAALLDTGNGYVYGVAEASGEQKQLSNAWNSRQAIDDSRRKAEQQAFDGLITKVKTMWQDVVKHYGPPAAATAGAG